MPRPNRFAWSNQPQEKMLAMARRASRDDLRLMARAYEWSDDPEVVLGWIMANRSIDLATALTVFFNGDPARFNYLSKRDVPEELQGAAKLLDNICLRLNSGFYRVSPGMKLERSYRLDRWLKFQQADRGEGRRGRWILDEAIVLTAVIPPKPKDIPDMTALRQQEPVAVDQPLATTLGKRVVELVTDLLPGRRAG